MRPTAITVLCLLLCALAAPKFINAAYSVLFFPGWVSIFGLTVSSLALLSTYALWKMKRWGVYLFIAVWAAQVLTLPLFPLDSARDDIRSWFFSALLIAYLIIVLPNWSSLKKLGAADDEDERLSD